MWSAGDVRQYAYCPRVPYYRYALPIPYRQTHTMRKGDQTERAELLLSRRRSFRRWGLEDARLEPHPYWMSERFRLCGIPDAALVTQGKVGILEFKDSPRGLTHGTKLQIAAYVLLAGDLYPDCEIVPLFYDPLTGQSIKVRVLDQLKREVLDIRDALEEMISSETLPDPTPHTSKCTECEYRRSCGDVVL